MEFEKAYQKFLNGTASPEEIEFVRNEMKRANDINGILANAKKDGATSNAEKETVKKAIKTYWRKDTLKILIIVCSVVLVVAIGISLAIGIPIYSNAEKNLNYSYEEAETIVTNYILQNYPESTGKIEVLRIEKELEVDGRIKNAHYIYTFEVHNGKDRVFEIEVDSKTGKILEVE